MARLQPMQAETTTGDGADDRPRVSLRLLMAASGRCSCDDCVRAYRDGDRRAGLVSVRRVHRSRLTVVR